eukprot:m.951058 g.951058  ORF g.951058 m.951058 type:complete len:1126 (+) comp23862_c0_seq1:135-3512(+)
MGTIDDDLYDDIVSSSVSAGMPRRELDWFFSRSGAPSVEDFLLSAPNAAEAYPWELGDNSSALMAERKAELLQYGTGKNPDILREWITLLQLEEAADAMAEFDHGSSFDSDVRVSPVAQQPVEVLSEDALYQRFLQQELDGHQTRAPMVAQHNTPGNARGHQKQQQRESTIGGLVGESYEGHVRQGTHAAPKINIGEYRKRDWISAGCAVKTVTLDVPAGVKVGLGLQRPNLGQIGIWVHKVTPKSAAALGLPPFEVNDVILEINGVSMIKATLADIEEILRPPCRSVAITLATRREVDATVAAMHGLHRGQGNKYGDDDNTGGHVTGVIPGGAPGGEDSFSLADTGSDADHEYDIGIRAFETAKTQRFGNAKNGHGGFAAMTEPRSMHVYDDEDDGHVMYDEGTGYSGWDDPNAGNGQTLADESDYGMRADTELWGGGSGYDDGWKTRRTPSGGSTGSMFNGDGLRDTGEAVQAGETSSTGTGSRIYSTVTAATSSAGTQGRRQGRGGDGGRQWDPLLSPGSADAHAYAGLDPFADPHSMEDAVELPSDFAAARCATERDEADARDDEGSGTDRVVGDAPWRPATKATVLGTPFIASPAAGSAAEANNPNLQIRELQRLARDEDFKTAVGTRDSVLATKPAYVEPAGSVAEANNPNRAMRDLARVDPKKDFKTGGKGGLTPLPAVIHEPYIDPSKLQQHWTSTKGSGTKKASSVPSTPRGKTTAPSPGGGARTTPRTRRVVVTSSSSKPTRLPSPSSSAGRTTRSKVGRALNFADKNSDSTTDDSWRTDTQHQADYDRHYFNALKTQNDDALHTYRERCTTLRQLVRDHVALVRGCAGHTHIARALSQLAPPTTLPPMYADDGAQPAPAFRDAVNAAAGGGLPGSKQELSEQCQRLTRALQEKHAVLADLSKRIVHAKTARNTALLTALEIQTQKVTLVRSTLGKHPGAVSPSGFGVQIATDDSQAMFCSTVVGTAPNIHILTGGPDHNNYVAHDASILMHWVIVQINDQSTLAWTHTQITDAFAQVEGDRILLTLAHPDAVASTNTLLAAAPMYSPGREQRDFSAGRSPARKSNRYSWQNGDDFREKMEIRAMELSKIDMDANPAALQEWLTLQEIRTALGML